MKYISINELSSFDFHDAIIDSIDLSDNEMTWIVSDANVYEENSQNNYDVAMCIDSAKIVFTNASVKKIVLATYVQSQDSGEGFHKAITAKESEHGEILRRTIDGNSIMGLDSLSVTDDNHFIACFHICSDADDRYYLTIRFSKVTVQWDIFDGKAWYETDE